MNKGANWQTWSRDRVEFDEQNIAMLNPYLQSTEADLTMRKSETRDRAGLPIIDVDILTLGVGPAGASLGCFLASHGTFKSSFSGHTLWWNT